MKVQSTRFKTAMFIGAAAILAIAVSMPAYSQESVKKEKQKQVTIKIITDENGKKTVIDTTMVLPASGLNDSVSQEIEKVIELNSGGKHSCIMMHKVPGGCAYKFEMPCPPDCLSDLDELENFEWHGMNTDDWIEGGSWEEMAPRGARRIMRMEGRGQTLNDMLGDIPMDRVVSYSIKDLKHGKRITIDLNDAPMFESQNKVVIIRDSGKKQRKYYNQHDKVRVEVNTGDGDQPDVPPPPPPPPPSSEPTKK